MSKRLCAASLRNPGRRDLKCLRCECDSPLCHVAFLGRSISKRTTSQRGTVACPVHSNVSGSKWALKFHDLIGKLSLPPQNLSVHGIVWDWHDLPGAGNHHRHLDACVFVGKHCYRFEVDGEDHFRDNNSSRLVQDTIKDDILTSIGVALVRLHWRDEGSWERHVLCALLGKCTNGGAVTYTYSYKDYIH